MTQVVHRRKLTVIPDQHDRFTIQNRDQKIEKGGLGNLIHDNDIDILRTDIHSLDPVVAQFCELGRCKPIAAGTGDPEHIDTLIQITRVRSAVVFQNVVLFQIFCNLTVNGDLFLIFRFGAFMIVFELAPLLCNNIKRRFQICGIILSYNAEIAEEKANLKEGTD